MKYRVLGNTGFKVSEISLGTWHLGASSVQQAQANVRVSDMPPLSDEKMHAVKELYEQYIKQLVHHLW